MADSDAANDHVESTAPAPVAEQAKMLVAQMTLEEKATLLSGNGWWSTHGVERLGISPVTMNDGPHGIRKSSPGAIQSHVEATCFPTGSALAATWNKELLREVGEAIGLEARTYGVNILLGPGINLKRSPLAGRNFEYYSEDPMLTGKLAAAFIEGVQSQGVGTALKHLAVNNQEFERMINSSNLDERTLHEIYLPAFEIAVKEAKPWSIMCAYNKVNGVYASENEELLTKVLRAKWGFEGFVMSDWGAVNDRVKGVEAGLNLEMPGSGTFNRDKIINAVQKGTLSQEALDRSVTELLTLMLRSKAHFKEASFHAEEHHELARRAAAESIVLLKNEDAILPLDLSRKQKIAIIGQFAREPRFQGAGSSQVKPTKVSSAFNELQKCASGGSQFVYAPGYNEEGDTDEALLKEASRTAAGADVAIVFAGLPDSYESEGFDRSSLEMPAGHNRLIFAVAGVQSNTVVVLMNGAAVTMPWIGLVKGAVEAWLGGQAGGGAIADVLAGKANPSGKLAETFPMRLEDTPTGTDFPGRNGETFYGEGIMVGYRHYDTGKIEPLFPFGFGLSYTQFVYESIAVDRSTVNAREGVSVDIRLRNAGAVAGKEVVQLYVRELRPKLIRPSKELKAFAKVELAPGEQKTVNFQLGFRDFAFYDAKQHDWVVNPGEFEILMGGSSRDLPLKQVITLESTSAPPQLHRESMLKEFRDHPFGRRFYPELLSAMGADLTEPAQEELATLSPSERAERKKARMMMMAFVNDFPIGKVPAWSEGKFSEERLSEILKQTAAPVYSSPA